MKKGGGQKRLRDKKGRQAKTNIKCPFLGEKNRVFGLLEAKKGKETKQQKKNEEGLGPSELALVFFFFSSFCFSYIFCFMFLVLLFFFGGGGLTFCLFFVVKKTCNRLSVSQPPSWSKVRSFLFCFKCLLLSVSTQNVFICIIFVDLADGSIYFIFVGSVVPLLFFFFFCGSFVFFFSLVWVLSFCYFCLVNHSKVKQKKKNTDNITATRSRGCSRKFWPISFFMGKYSLIWAKPRKFSKKKHNFEKKKKKHFTKIYERSHPDTPTKSSFKHGWPPKNPIFPGFFSRDRPRNAKHPNPPKKLKKKNKVGFLGSSVAWSPKCKQRNAASAVNFAKTGCRQKEPDMPLNPYFCSAKN